MKIVYAYAVADLLHIGHLHAFENAKSIAGKDGRLIVGVLTDGATMEKKKQPTISFEERIRMVRALECVDVAVMQDTYSPLKNVRKIKPDILMESDSHTEEDLLETNKVCDKINCKIMMMPYYGVQSSTGIKNNIKNNGK
jgi:phosphoenolpyruvate phosphomutase